QQPGHSSHPVSEIGTHHLLTSVIAIACPHLAPEYVVGPAGIHEEAGDDEQRADQGEALTRRGPGGLPEMTVRRDDVRPETDAQATVTQEDQTQRQHEGAALRATFQ